MLKLGIWASGWWRGEGESVMVKVWFARTFMALALTSANHFKNKSVVFNELLVIALMDVLLVISESSSLKYLFL